MRKQGNRMIKEIEGKGKARIVKYQRRKNDEKVRKNDRGERRGEKKGRERKERKKVKR